MEAYINLGQRIWQRNKKSLDVSLISIISWYIYSGKQVYFMSLGIAEVILKQCFTPKLRQNLMTQSINYDFRTGEKH